MPKRGDDRDKGAEDLFEDLDRFFEPIREPDWPEGAPGEPPGTAGSSEEAADEDWPEIAVPEEAEMLGESGREDPELTLDDLKKAPPQYADLPGVTAAATGEEAKPQKGRRRKGRRGKKPEASVEEPPPPEVDEPEPEGASEPQAEAPVGTDAAQEEVEGARATDEDRLAAEFGMLEEPAPGEPVDLAAEEASAATAAGADAPVDEEPEERPDREAVEAAADHFAEGLRASPEEVEADLLADLEAPREQPETVSIEPPSPTEPTTPSDVPPVTVGHGPAWQEPGMTVAETEEIAPSAPPAPGRNLIAAATTGGILAVAALALLAWGKAPFAVLATAVILLGQGEMYAVMRMRGRNPATALGLVAGLVLLAGGYTAGEPGVLLGAALAMITSVLWYMMAPAAARSGTTVDAAATMLGLIYVPFLASFALVILRVPGDVGTNLLLTVLGLTVLYDILAYAVGSFWGNRALAPTISPAKSWEGAFGATLVVLFVAISLVPMIPPFTPATAVGLALVVAVFAPLGDLVESAFKRDLGVKDMSSILPGHGGILDRIDSILFTAPAAWYFIRLVF